MGYIVLSVGKFVLVNNNNLNKGGAFLQQIPKAQFVKKKLMGRGDRFLSILRYSRFQRHFKAYQIINFTLP